MEFNMKICSKCEVKKEPSEFSKHKLHSDGLYSQCKICVTNIKKTHEYRFKSNLAKRRQLKIPKYRELNSKRSKAFRSTEKGKLYILNDGLKRNYGITLQKYNELFQAQNGCCAICERHSTEFSKRLHVDHDHKTNEIRGLLCHHCNTAIGSFLEDTDLMLKAIQFLQKHKKTLELIKGE